jgi:hypothetical protein
MYSHNKLIPISRPTLLPNPKQNDNSPINPTNNSIGSRATIINEENEPQKPYTSEDDFYGIKPALKYSTTLQTHDQLILLQQRRLND